LEQAFAIVGLVAEPGAQVDRERPDADLIREAQKGSHRAYEELVRRYSERAYRAAYRVVRDAQIAEDVLQEALLKAYQSLRKFENRSSFYTWLYRITVNLALDRQRRVKRAAAVEWSDEVAHQVEPRGTVYKPANPELAAERVQVLELVSDGIQELPDGQREVLLLREVEGLSYEEIAETMEISKGTVMSRLHYARRKLTAFLTERGVSPEDVIE
jgi:RNA polymerase sigma-70 factor (ECF subfamily)